MFSPTYYPLPPFLFFFLICIGVQLIYNVVLVSTVQQSESATRICISPLFCISFPFRSPQSTEQSFLCYTVGSHQLSILYIESIVYICQSQSPNSSHHSPLPIGNHQFVLYICESVSVLLYSFVCFIFRIPHTSDNIQYLSFTV